MFCTFFYKILLVIGGQAPKAIRSVECFDFKEERWYQLAEMPTRRCRCGKFKTNTQDQLVEMTYHNIWTIKSLWTTALKVAPLFRTQGRKLEIFLLLYIHKTPL